jgi:Flp pilus assembly protein TadD
MQEVARSGSIIAGLALGVVIAVGAGWAMADQMNCDALLEQAQQMLKHQRPKQARVTLRSALAKCPRNAQAYSLLGISYDQQNLYPEAEKAYQKAITLDPNWAGFHNNLAASYLRAGKTTEAIAEFQKALRLDPQNHLAGLNLADYYLNRNDYARSLRYFRQADADRSQDPVVLFGLAKAYFGARQPQSGLEIAEKLSRLAGADSKIHFSLGLLLAENCRYGEAIRELQAIPPRERDFAVYQNLGLAYMKSGKASEAEGAFEEAMRLNPASPEPYLELGQIFSSTHRLEQGIYWLSQAHQRAPQRPDITFALAEGLIQARQLNRADDLLAGAVRQNPHDAALLQGVGDLYTEEQKDELAKRAYERSLEIDPHQLGSRLGLAKLYDRLGKNAQAQEEYEAILKRAPGNTEANLGLGRLALQSGKFNEAVTSLEKALRSDPNNQSAMENLAAARIHLGQYAEAQDVLQRLVTMNADNSRAHYLLGQTLLKMGQKKKAELEFERSRQLKSASATR